MTDRYNLADEKFIPLIGGNYASLKDLFQKTEPCKLALDPWYFIPLMRLLLCIGQASVRLQTDAELEKLSFDDFRQSVLSYLKAHHDDFFLYGSRPFLQIKALDRYFTSENAKPIHAFLPYKAFGNNVVLRDSSVSKDLFTDAQKALMVIAITTHGLSLKRYQNNIAINCKKKKPTGRISPFLGVNGIIHSFYLGRSVAESVWLNLVSEEAVSSPGHGFTKMGRPCWELEVDGEEGAAADEIRESYLGRLAPLVRFCLLDEQSNLIVCTDGIEHYGHLDQYCDFSMTRRLGKKGLDLLPANPLRKPWRDLDAFLGFAVHVNERRDDKYSCELLARGFARTQRQGYLAVWCGGISLKYNSGEQKISGSSDFVCSELELISEKNFAFEPAFIHYTNIMKSLDLAAKFLRTSIWCFFEDLYPKTENSTGKTKKSKPREHPEADRGLEQYWQSLDGLRGMIWTICFTDLLSAERERMESELIKSVNSALFSAYDTICPPSSARLLILNCKHRPKGLKNLCIKEGA